MNGFSRYLLSTLLLVLAGIASAEIETVTWLHTDRQGSPLMARDAQGNTLWQEDYSPWGERLALPSANIADIGYTGHYEEADIGLTYAQARWYDPAVARFLSADAVLFSASNLRYYERYSYAAQSPYIFIDPDGREIKSVRSGSDTCITFTAIIVDKTGSLKSSDLEVLAARIKGQIESSYTGGEGIERWVTTAEIDVLRDGERRGSRHVVEIRDASYFKSPRVLGRVNKIGGDYIRINRNAVGMMLDGSHGNASFERTSAHEFGHAAGLLHESGGLMSQTSISDSLEIGKIHIDKIHEANK